ncbi:MAG: hypothetical protein RIN56_15855 [Sporomusaceae bacterium]|nr:hypothetical protein [Sporomusaceae bacterium]
MGDSFKIVPTKDTANTRVSGQKFADYRGPDGGGPTVRRKTPAGRGK